MPNLFARLRLALPCTALSAAALASLALPAGAALLQGSVRNDAGQPVAGAMVIVSDARGVSEMVYSNDQGIFRLDASLRGKLDLKVRKRFHADFDNTLPVPGKQTKPLAVTLPALTDARAISEDHPSLSHFSQIDFDEDEKGAYSRANFARDCLTCHQVGNKLTRGVRAPEAWEPTLQRMHGYIGNPDSVRIKDRAKMLATAFDERIVNSRPEVPADPLLEQAKVYRWRLQGAGLPHDADIHSNGKAYIVDQFSASVIEVDLATGKINTYKEPDDGMPPGGWFAKHGMPPSYGLTVSHGPHSLAEGNDGHYYITDALGATIAEFDPKTKKFRHHDLGNDGAVYPHTIRVDHKTGMVWFTIIGSNHVGRLDPVTKKVTTISLPMTPSLSVFSQGPGPYGIDINPKDGSVWYAKLFSDLIGRVDPKTLAVTEMASPVRGPRRQRFDASGTLWVAGFAEGAIARINVDTKESKVYKLPEYAKGEVPAPYALAVHPQTQEIWVNDSMLDLVWRFLPKEERFVAYPVPLKGTYTRDFSFTKKGWACTSNNPIPAASLEGAQPELICIDAQAKAPAPAKVAQAAKP